MARRRPKAPLPAGEVSANTRQTRSQQQGIDGSLVDGTLVAGLVELIPPPPVLTESGGILDSAPHLRMFMHRHHPYLQQHHHPLSYVVVVAVVIAVKITPPPCQECI